MNDLHRDVRKYLIETYGATGVSIVYSGRHPRLHWSYRDRSYQMVVPGTTSDHRSVKNCLADLKRLLGPPPEPESNQPRKLEEMIPHAPIGTLAEVAKITVLSPPPTFRSFNGQVAHYQISGRHQHRLEFILPSEVRGWFNDGVRVSRTGIGTWELYRDPQGKTRPTRENILGVSTQEGHLSEEVQRAINVAVMERDAAKRRGQEQRASHEANLRRQGYDEAYLIHT